MKASMKLFRFFLWQDLTTPTVHTKANVFITIPQGANTESVLNILHRQGIIKNTLPLRLCIKFINRKALLKAGDYNFASPISPLEVLRQLELGGTSINRITVIEGWTRFDIAKAMANLPQLKLKPIQALSLMNDTHLIKRLDSRAKNLEGYLYPETYFLVSNTTAKDLVTSMIEQFKTIWTNKLADSASTTDKKVHELVTVASIIETEAKLNEERPIVSSVIYNRLRRNIPLSVDSTVVYASKLAGKWKNDGKVYESDVERKSPYNTRLVHGLPPGPICSPGLPSLQAAIYPANTSFIYYVRNPARNDGAHNFYDNEKDFEQGVQALRAWEEKHKR
jgi:UPF0755 protein